MTFPFRPEPLGGEHERSLFRSGEEALDRYFQTQVTQDIRRRVANCFVAVEVSTTQIAAYYTISAASIPLSDLPADEIRRLPRYPTVPAIRIGRLAVDQRFQGCGLGAALLADAAARTMKADAAAFTLLVDAKNDRVVEFYRRFGFRTLASQLRTLFLPLATGAEGFHIGKPPERAAAAMIGRPTCDARTRRRITGCFTAFSSVADSIAL